MAGCCLSLTIVCGSILPNLPPETVPWGTPPHTKNCRVEVFQWLPQSSSGIIYCPIVPSSGLSTGIGFECVKHSHQWPYGWELTSFLRNRQEGMLGLCGCIIQPRPQYPWRGSLSPPDWLLCEHFVLLNVAILCNTILKTTRSGYSGVPNHMENCRIQAAWGELHTSAAASSDVQCNPLACCNWAQDEGTGEHAQQRPYGSKIMWFWTYRQGVEFGAYGLKH